MTDREVWGWRDRRDGKRVSASSTLTREQAERQLEAWHARDRKGGRPDLHDLMPHLEVYRIHPPEECDNYLPPLTCLTAPSSESGRCDKCAARAQEQP